MALPEAGSITAVDTRYTYEGRAAAFLAVVGVTGNWGHQVLNRDHILSSRAEGAMRDSRPAPSICLHLFVTALRSFIESLISTLPDC